MADIIDGRSWGLAFAERPIGELGIVESVTTNGNKTKI